MGRGQRAFGDISPGLHLYFQQDAGWENRNLPAPPGEGLKVSDIDRDGRADIATASMHQAQSPAEGVVLLQGTDSVGWTKRIVSEHGSHGMRILDVDRDGIPICLARTGPGVINRSNSGSTGSALRSTGARVDSPPHEETDRCIH